MKPHMLMALLGGKSKDKPVEEEVTEGDGESGGSMLDEFISAVIDGDKEGAKAAFKSAVRSCSMTKKADPYEDDDEDV